MKQYILLAIAIIAEVIATTFLKGSDGLSRPIPALAALCGYGLAFYFLSLVLKNIPVGVAYATWSGTGIILIATSGWIFYDQQLNEKAILGIAFIIVGVVLVNVFSPSTR